MSKRQSQAPAHVISAKGFINSARPVHLSHQNPRLIRLLCQTPLPNPTAVYRDLGKPNADLEQFKAILAAEIIKSLDAEGLSVRKAQEQTGVAAADFSRIRNADFRRFTEDRLMAIINRLGSQVEVSIKVRRQSTSRRAA